MSAPALQTQAKTQPTDVNFEALLSKIDAYSVGLPQSVFERFSFELDGVPVTVRRIKEAEGDRFLISASIGILPFSIESPERRNAVKVIVEAAKTLPNVHFTIDMAGRITAGGLFESSRVVPPDFIFHPLTLFLQEARPFMQLIARYLQKERQAAA